MRKLAENWGFAQTAANRRFGRVALKPLFTFPAGAGGASPDSASDRFRLLAAALPNLTPRLIRSVGARLPGRIFPDAAVLGDFASCLLSARGVLKLSTLMTGIAGNQLRERTRGDTF